MRFKTQYDLPPSFGREFNQYPCANFEPGQGQTVAQVINNFVQGIESDTPNLNGYQTPELAAAATAFRGNRSLAIDNAFGAFENGEHIQHLQELVTDDELKIIQLELLSDQS